MSLRVSTLALEGNYQGAKYLKFHVLCDKEELKELFDRLGTFWLFHLTGIGDGKEIGREIFLEEYGNWIEELKKGNVPTDSDLRKILAAALTLDLNALWKQSVPGDRFIIKVHKPVVQIQAHFFTYSSLDGVFRPMTMGSESIFWGLQLSYPQIYQDPKTMQFCEMDETANIEAFQIIKQWVRDVTRPTPFVVDEKKTNVPIRLGKNCFSWIHSHPQLAKKQMSVYV